MAKQSWREQGKHPRRESADPSPGAQRAGWRDRGARKGLGMPQASTVKIIMGSAGLLLVLTLLVLVVLWFVPAPAPRLVLLSSIYKTELLDPNDYATRDAQRLIDLSPLFDVSRASAASLEHEKMKQLINELDQHQPSRSFFNFSWEKTVTLAYVNTVGVALSTPGSTSASAYLLPADVDVRDSVLDKAIPLSAVIEKLAQGKSDYQVLVLDCQRLRSLWPLGVLQNRFVQAAREEIDAFRRSHPNAHLYVLFSSSGAQGTWPDPTEKRSVFGNAFFDGVRGGADNAEGANRDGRVSLRELADYAFQKTRVWVEQERNDRQHPWLSVPQSDQSDDVIVAVTGRTEIAPASRADDDLQRESLRDDLKKAWERRYLARWNGPLVRHRASAAGRSATESLLAAERYRRAADPDETRRRIDTAMREMGRLEAASAPTPGRPLTASLALWQRDQPNDARAASAPFEDITSPRPKRPLVDALDDLSRGGSKTTLPPVEFHLLRLLQSLSLGDKQFMESLDGAKRAAVESQWKEVARQARASEEAAVPALLDAPELSAAVFPWVADRVQDVDRKRVQLEDAYFSIGATPIVMGDSAAGPRPLLDKEIAEVKRAGIEVAHALRAYERALEELPYWVTLAARPPWDGRPEEFHKTVEQGTFRALTLAQQLSANFEKGPSPSLPGQVGEIHDLQLALVEELDKLGALYRKTLHQARVGGSPSAATQKDWRHVDDLLSVPFPLAPDDPILSAKTRVDLSERQWKPVRQDQALSSTSSGGRQAARIEEDADKTAPIPPTAELASKYFRLAAQAVIAIKDRTASEIDAEVRAAWLKQKSLSEELGEDEPAAWRSDQARRLMEGALPSRTRDMGEQRLQRQESAFLCRQALRVLKSQWAGLDNEKPYFLRAVDECLADVRHVNGERNLIERAKREQRDVLNQFQARSLGFASAEPLRLLGQQATIDLRLNLSRRPEDVGEAALRLYSQPADVVVARTRQATVRDARIDVERSSDLEARGAVRTELIWRGQRLKADLDIDAPALEAGPTTTYHDTRPNTGLVRGKIDVSDKAQPRILFVLDCSGSMSSDNKMEDLIKVLNRFGDSVAEGSIQVGIRVLGLEVPYSGPASEAAKLAPLRPKSAKDSQTILEMENFAKPNFEAATGRLKAVGGTPLYYALSEAAEDFRKIQADDKRLIIISDGDDIFWDQDDIKNYPSAQSLREKFLHSKIDVRAIGFRYAKGKEKDFVQLVKLIETMTGSAQTAKGESKVRDVNDTEELFKAILGFSGQRRLIVQRPGQPLTDSVALKRSWTFTKALPVGSYTARGADYRNDYITDAAPFNLGRGETRSFLLQVDKLVEDQDWTEIFGSSSTPTGKVEMKIHATPLKSDRGDAGDVEFRIVLGKRGDPRWRPSQIRATIVPEGKEEPRYLFLDVPPNDTDLSAPAWRFTLRQFPAARRAVVQVRWIEPGETVTTHTLERNQREGAARPRAQIRSWDSRESRQEQVNGANYPAVRVVLVFPADVKRFDEWGIQFPGDVVFARQTYNSKEKVYVGIFAFQQSRPGELILTPPLPALPNQTIERTVTIGSQSLGE